MLITWLARWLFRHEARDLKRNNEWAERKS
jgi:hypothetical protein